MSKAIPYRFYRDKDGRTFSPYTSWKTPSAVLVTEGFTVEHPDGTSGLGRKPFATIEDAQAWCDANPNFKGMGQ